MRSAPLSIAAPFEIAQAGTTLALLAWETQLVMTMRVLGMAGVWSVVPSENARMVSEKAPAWAEATQAATGAALAGKRPDEVAAAWAKPLRRRTSANALRLGRRGLKLR
jgi:hypothetical protein